MALLRRGAALLSDFPTLEPWEAGHERISAMQDIHDAAPTSNLEVMIMDGQIICQREVMTCGDCGQPIPPSVLEDGSLIYLGADEEGPSFLLLQCPVCPVEEVK
jgi:hypothetical protein